MAVKFVLQLGYNPSFVLSAADAARVMQILAEAKAVDDKYCGETVWVDAEADRVSLITVPEANILSHADYLAKRDAYEVEREALREAARAEEVAVEA